MDNHTCVPDEIFEELMWTRLPGRETRVLMTIFRCVYGNDLLDGCPLRPSLIAALTRLSLPAVSRSLRGLTARKIISYSSETDAYTVNPPRQWRPHAVIPAPVSAPLSARVSKRVVKAIQKYTEPAVQRAAACDDPPRVHEKLGFKEKIREISNEIKLQRREAAMKEGLKSAIKGENAKNGESAAGAGAHGDCVSGTGILPVGFAGARNNQVSENVAGDDASLLSNTSTSDNKDDINRVLSINTKNEIGSRDSNSGGQFEYKISDDAYISSLTDLVIVFHEETFYEKFGPRPFQLSGRDGAIVSARISRLVKLSPKLFTYFFFSSMIHHNFHCGCKNRPTHLPDILSPENVNEYVAIWQRNKNLKKEEKIFRHG